MKKIQLFILILCLLGYNTKLYAQAYTNNVFDTYLDSLKKNNLDTIVEIRINTDNAHAIHFPTTYLYFKNKTNDFCKYFGVKFYNKEDVTTKYSYCDDNFQILFELIKINWKTIMNEKIIPDSITFRKGQLITSIISSPNYYDVVEVLVYYNGKIESKSIRKDYFLPTENKLFKKNISTKTFLFLTIIDSFNEEISKKTN